MEDGNAFIPEYRIRQIIREEIQNYFMPQPKPLPDLSEESAQWAAGVVDLIRDKAAGEVELHEEREHGRYLG